MRVKTWTYEKLIQHKDGTCTSKTSNFFIIEGEEKITSYVIEKLSEGLQICLIPYNHCASKIFEEI